MKPIVAVPKAFISYSHDSQDHKRWVLEFATRLRNAGVDAILDQWELRPGDDLPHFMERNLVAADRVLMIRTPNYVTKANAGSGGVGYEKMIVTADLLKSIDSNKVIPIIRQTGTPTVPVFLKSKLFLDFSRPDQFEFSFDELVRTLHNAPLFTKPPVANRPFTPVTEFPPERTGDAIHALMKIVVEDFEAGRAYSFYRLLADRTGMSRSLLDLTIINALAEGLIKVDHDRDVSITDKGKHYAITHQLDQRPKAGSDSPT